MEIKNLKECFKLAIAEEQKGKKHKGLLVTTPNQKRAEEYITKAKDELELCDFFKDRGTDYKIVEQWYYILYYCAISILARIGIESRSQKCTALCIKYLKEREVIEYGDKFIDKITVHKEKGKESEVDKREEARYGSWIRNDEVRKRYDEMINLCKEAISQTEEIVFSNQ